MQNFFAVASALTISIVLVAGCASAENPGKVWHTPDGFRNLPGGLERDIPFHVYLEYSWRRLRETGEPPPVPLGHVLPEDQSVALMQAMVGDDSLTWIGHATFLINLGGVTILTDPFFSERASPFTFIGPKRFVMPGVPLSSLPPIDIIFLSHNHYDHLDVSTLERLPNKKSIAAIVPLGLGSELSEFGFGRVHEMDWYEQVVVEGVTITALPAHHWSRRGIRDENRTLWMGAAIEGNGKRLYVSGDTAIAPYFSDLGEQYGPFDYGIVGIGAYEPREMMRFSHTTPEEAMELALAMGARTLVAGYWGTIELGTEPPFEAPDRFRSHAKEMGLPPERVWILAIGETRILR